MYWFEAWPGGGPFSYLSPLMGLEWLYGREACWLFFRPYAWQWYTSFSPWYRPASWITPICWW